VLSNDLVKAIRSIAGAVAQRATTGVPARTEDPLGGPDSDRIAMSKRVLLAWELGGGRGHLLIIGWIAEELRKRGFEPVFALQRLDGIEPIRAFIGEDECHQSPVWPGLIDRSAFHTPGQPVTTGDLLGGLGLKSEAAVEGMLRAWDSLIAKIDPAVIVADFAPACLTAARGKVPTVAVGDGFTLPPTTLEQFPNFESDEAVPQINEAELLATVNGVLRKLGARELRCLPELFAADRSRASSFTELDPYRKYRKEPVIAPWVPKWDISVPMLRTEIFGYFSVNTDTRRTALLALANTVKAGVPARVFIPDLDAATDEWLTANGIVSEPVPIPFEEIQRNAALIVSLGSFGLASCALASGIPQIIMPIGIAKAATGRAIEELGVGRWAQLNTASPIEPALLEPGASRRLRKLAVHRARQGTCARFRAPTAAEFSRCHRRSRNRDRLTAGLVPLLMLHRRRSVGVKRIDRFQAPGLTFLRSVSVHRIGFQSGARIRRAPALAISTRLPPGSYA
jgi:rhamnosyltransferase subunit B